jgi:ABC-type branched-subunit amino acid transport system substrate-binding protein
MVIRHLSRRLTMSLLRARRPWSRQLVGAAAIASVLFATASCGDAASPTPATSSGSTQPSAASPSSVSTASTSSRGVTRNNINVVFPVVSLGSLAGREGFAADTEFGEQAKAINLFVKQVNDTGGISGRKINPIIVNFDPTNEIEMRALCKTWTEGSPPVFAVVDGLGDWTGDNELCITQEGHTPFIGAWTTVTDWTNEGSPYLWWLGADQATILQAVVNWGLSANLIGSGIKVGVVAGSRASDQTALNDYLLPDLAAAGVTPIVKTIDADPNDTATTDAQAPLVIQQLRGAGVTSLIPLIPFNVFYPLLEAETDQQYFPRLLLSDYESSILSSLGLMPVPYGKALNGQEGVTTETLGGIDGPLPESQGGYDPGLRTCWNLWHHVYPETPPGNIDDDIEEQGPIAGWCQAITLFATAARNAGPDLNRRTFVTAMSKIRNFPGTWYPTLSYGPDKRYGPTQYQVVELHINSPPSSLCKSMAGIPPVGTCWVSVGPWQSLPSG